MSVPTVPTQEIVDLGPFRKMVMTIGSLPTAFTESMTYYEALAFFANYLEKTVIPAVNQNAEATQELQNLFVELKDYVDHYFDNLNVQEEINNKLDDMAESGQLAEIITTYLQLNGVLAFNTIEDMSEAEYIIEGSVCRTLGYLSYNDGFGQYYKIRAKTELDTPDGFNLVSLDVSDSLIAERINENNEKYIIIGDSYLAGDGLSNPATENYGYILRQKLGMTSDNCKLLAEGGAGFITQGNSGHTFLTLLQASIAQIDTNNTTKIIVCGGINDINESTADIKGAINNFMLYCKSTFPKANVYLGCISGDAKISNSAGSYRLWLRTRVLPAYRDCAHYGAIYLNGCDKVLHNYDYIQNGENRIHPTAAGHQALADYLYNTLMNQPYDYYAEQTLTNGVVPAGASGSITFKTGIENTKCFITLYCALTFTEDIESGYITAIDIGEQDLQYLRYVALPSTIYSTDKHINILYSDNTHESVPCKLKVTSDGHITIWLGYIGKAIKAIEMGFTKFEWDYLTV